MPFVTEELWQRIAEDGPARDAMLIHTAWPELDFADADAADELNWLVDVISSVRSVRAEMNVPAGARTSLVVLGVDDALKARFDTQLPAIERLARVDDLTFADTAPAESAQIVIGSATICLPLAGVVDLDAERARLDKELKKLDGDITRIDKKLGNEQFLAKAPEEVVEGRARKARGVRPASRQDGRGSGAARGLSLLRQNDRPASARPVPRYRFSSSLLTMPSPFLSTLAKARS